MLRRIFLSIAAFIYAASTAHGASTYTIDGTTFDVHEFPISASITDTTPLPLDIAINKQNGNTIYMVPEFDRRIYSVSRIATDGTTMTTIEISAPASPLFRNNSDGGSVFSFQQERIQTTSDGSVWVSQGGLCFTASTKNNWSRVMRLLPSGTWEAYTLPVDSACAIGFFVTDPPTRLWVMSAGTNFLYATFLRWWHEGETTATRYPPVDNRWDRAVNFGNGFPAQLTRLADGRLVGTLYFGSAFFIYDFRTATYASTALSSASTLYGAGIVLNSTGPWQIRQHTDGNIWIVEDYAKRVTKVALAGGQPAGVQTTIDIASGLSTDENPHSLVFDGSGNAYVTTYPLSSSGDGRLVKITNAGAVTYGPSFATIGLEGGLTGIERDSTGAIWVACFRKRRIVRLTPQ